MDSYSISSENNSQDLIETESNIFSSIEVRGKSPSLSTIFPSSAISNIAENSIENRSDLEESSSSINPKDNIYILREGLFNRILLPYQPGKEAKYKLSCTR